MQVAEAFLAGVYHPIWSALTTRPAMRGQPHCRGVYATAAATGFATGTVNTSGDTAKASGSAEGTATGTVDSTNSTTVHHDSL
jgi:hypothetical protein